MDDTGRPLTAREKRQEQLKRWQNSATDLECSTYNNPRVRVKFNDGAVFLAACSSGDIHEIEQLLANGADINYANVDGLTALHEACIDGNLDVVQFLVKNGADIDQEDNEGWSPLHATASCGFIDIAKYLVRNGANVAAVNSEGEVPLDIAEDDDMIDYLTAEVDKQGVDINEARNREQQIMLQDARQRLNAYLNGDKVVEERHGNAGATALHIAAAKGYEDVIKILLQAGSSTNSLDHDGWTPLHAASHWSQQNSAKILVDRGGDLNVRSKLGQTPFDVADEDMLEFLESIKDTQSLKKPSNEDIDRVIEIPAKTIKKTSPSEEDTKLVKENGGIENGKKSPDETEVTRNKRNDFASKFARTTPMEDEEDGIEINFDSTSTPRPHSLPFERSSNTGNKPVAATQPVQSVSRYSSYERRNGTTTPTTPSAGQISSTKSKKFTEDKNTDIKDSTPASWRSGLRKTGSFDEKLKPTAVLSGIGRSESESTFNKKGEPRLARVPPLTETKRNVDTTDTDSTSRSSGRRRLVSDLSNFPSTPAATADDRSFKRSTSYMRAVGRTFSAENDDSISRRPRSRPPFLSSTAESVKENDKSDESITPSSTSTSLSTEDTESKDRRRSHLQPVRDEEAEARRRAKSRHQRQTRRSTQGVTLDVVEEAMRTIGGMKEKKAEKKEQETAAAKDQDDSSVGKIPHNDSTLLYKPHSHHHATPSSLPSGYVPKDQRVKQSSSMDNASSITGVVVPTISVFDDNEKAQEKKKDENLSIAEAAANATAAQRKTSQQQRRRQRKDRRSTGLPELESEEAETNAQALRKGSKIYDDNFQMMQKLDNQINSDLTLLKNLAKVSNRQNDQDSTSEEEKFVSTPRNNKSVFKMQASASRRSAKPYGGYFSRCSMTPRTSSPRDKFGSPRRSLDSSLLTPKSPICSLNPNANKTPCCDTDCSIHNTPQNHFSKKRGVNPLKRTHPKPMKPLFNTPLPVHSAKFNRTPQGQSKTNKSQTEVNIKSQKCSKGQVEVINSSQDQRVNDSIQDRPTVKDRSYGQATEFDDKSRGEMKVKRNYKGQTEVMDRSKNQLKVNEKFEGLVIDLLSSGDPKQETAKVISVTQVSETISLDPIDIKDTSANEAGRKKRPIRKYTGSKIPVLIRKKLKNAAAEESNSTNNKEDSSQAERLRPTAAKYDSSSRNKNSLDVDSSSRLSTNDKTKNNEDSKDYKILYDQSIEENERLQSKLEEMKRQVKELQSRLDLVDDEALRRQIDMEKREKREWQKKYSDLEKSSSNVEELKTQNTLLKNENKALVRIVEKLGGPVSLVKQDPSTEESSEAESEEIAPSNEKLPKSRMDSLTTEPLESKRSSISSSASGDDNNFQRSSSLRSYRDNPSYSTRARDRSQDRITDRSAERSTYVPRSSRLDSSTYSNPITQRRDSGSRGYTSSKPYSSSLSDKPPSGSSYRSLPASSPVINRTSPRNSFSSSARSATPAYSSRPSYSASSYASPTPRKKYSHSSKPSSLTSKLTSSLSSFSASKRPVKY